VIEFHVEKSIWSDSVTFYAREQINGEWRFLVADGVKVVSVPTGEMAPKFFDLYMMGDGAQSLFDGLWKAGFRPHKGESGIAHVEALRYHLEDMRKLVFWNSEKRELQGEVK
jgi:hypothetical protein